VETDSEFLIEDVSFLPDDSAGSGTADGADGPERAINPLVPSIAGPGAILSYEAYIATLYCELTEFTEFDPRLQARSHQLFYIFFLCTK